MREHAATRLLSEEDRIAGFIKATGGFAGSARRWKERAAKGMTDAELAEALAFELGIAGGSGGPDSLSLWFQGAGLRIWISWEIRNTRQTKPTFQGSPLFNAAAISGSSEMLLAIGVSANLGVAALAAFAIYGAAKTLRSLRVPSAGSALRWSAGARPSGGWKPESCARLKTPCAVKSRRWRRPHASVSREENMTACPQLSSIRICTRRQGTNAGMATTRVDALARP